MTTLTFERAPEESVHLLVPDDCCSFSIEGQLFMVTPGDVLEVPRRIAEILFPHGFVEVPTAASPEPANGR